MVEFGLSRRSTVQMAVAAILIVGAVGCGKSSGRSDTQSQGAGGDLASTTTTTPTTTTTLPSVEGTFTTQEGADFHLTATVLQDITVTDPDTEIPPSCPIGELPDEGTRFMTVMVTVQNTGSRAAGAPITRLGTSTGSSDEGVKYSDIDSSDSPLHLVQKGTTFSPGCAPTGFTVGDPDEYGGALGMFDAGESLSFQDSFAYVPGEVKFTELALTVTEGLGSTGKSGAFPIMTFGSPPSKKSLKVTFFGPSDDSTGNFEESVVVGSSITLTNGGSKVCTLEASSSLGNYVAGTNGADDLFQPVELQPGESKTVVADKPTSPHITCSVDDGGALFPPGSELSLDVYP